MQCISQPSIFQLSTVPSRLTQRLRLLLLHSDELDLNKDVLGETRDLDRASRRLVVGKVLAIDLVKSHEIIHVLQEVCGLQDVVEV